MSLIYEGGASTGSPQMTQALAQGTQQGQKAYEVQVSAEGGEGLWNIARDVHGKLQGDMQKANTVDEIYKKLVQDATQGKDGQPGKFQAGSDDGRIPGQYQGDQKKGRDLDLIYANDKFNITLDRPETGAAKAEGPEAQAMADWPPEAKKDFEAFSSQHPEAFKVNDTSQEAADHNKMVMAGWKHAYDNKKLPEYQSLVTSKEFTSLNAPTKGAAIELWKKVGAADTKTIISDPGFQALKDAKVISKDGKDNRSAQILILEKAGSDPAYRKTLLDIIKADPKSGFDPFAGKTDVQRGQAFAFMGMYTGRNEGYKKNDDDDPMNQGSQEAALKNLWNNLVSEPEFWTAQSSGRYSVALNAQQYGRIESWVGKEGYEKPSYKPLG